ncbi:acyl carrier protein [Streptomyces sp. KLOTTS4A1]|uniref:acyl carrier protein n=1 Tax=Streptomyces sp. KLOTTS4A1 TaxID=3390996 RepID=UPI0039F5E323
MIRELETILRDDLNVPADQLTPETSLEAAGIDSLAIVELSVLLAERHGITVSDAELNRLTHLHELDQLIRSRTADKERSAS